MNKIILLNENGLKNKMFGPHLTLDLYGCNEKKVSDNLFILNLLEKLVNVIKMHKITDPQILSFPGNLDNFDNGGITAYVPITESHITIHTFPKNGGFASIDIFSCKNFDTQKATKFLISELEPKKIERHLMMRGRHFPFEFEKAKKIILKQRMKNIKQTI